MNYTLSGFGSSLENLLLFESEALLINQYGINNNREYSAEVFRMYPTSLQLLFCYQNLYMDL